MNQEIIDYYINLLIIQYHNKANAQGTVGAVVKAAADDDVIFDVRDGYSVNDAIGVQLDIIGKYVGIDRFYQSQDITGVHFGFSDTDSFEPPDVTGYASTSDFLSKDGSYLSIFDIVGNGFSLSDDDFRTLIKLKILINYSNFSTGDIDDILFEIFGTDLYAIDNRNMSMEYFTSSDLSLIVRVALAKGLLPAPMGVRINSVVEELVYFGFSSTDSLEPPNVTGYASVADFLTKQGTFLGLTNIIA